MNSSPQPAAAAAAVAAGAPSPTRKLLSFFSFNRFLRRRSSNDVVSGAPTPAETSSTAQPRPMSRSGGNAATFAEQAADQILTPQSDAQQEPAAVQCSPAMGSPLPPEQLSQSPHGPEAELRDASSSVLQHGTPNACNPGRDELPNCAADADTDLPHPKGAPPLKDASAIPSAPGNGLLQPAQATLQLAPAGSHGPAAIPMQSSASNCLPEQPNTSMLAPAGHQHATPAPEAVRLQPGSPASNAEMHLNSARHKGWIMHRMPSALAEGDSMPDLQPSQNAADHNNPLYNLERTPRLGPPSARGFKYFQIPAGGGHASDELSDLLTFSPSAEDVSAQPKQVPATRSFSAEAPACTRSQPAACTVDSRASVRMHLLPAQVQAQLGTMYTPRGSSRPLVSAHIPLHGRGSGLAPVTLSLSAENSTALLPAATGAGRGDEHAVQGHDITPPRSYPLPGLGDGLEATPPAADSKAAASDVPALAAHDTTHAQAADSLIAGPVLDLADVQDALCAESSSSSALTSRRQAALAQLKARNKRRPAGDRSAYGSSPAVSGSTQ